MHLSPFTLSSLMRGNLYSLLFYGIQGIFLGFTYSSLTVILEKIFPQTQRQPLIYNQLIGTISGAISSLPSVYLSWIGFSLSTSQSDVYVPTELLRNEITGLSLFLLGSTLLGSFVGFGIGYMKRAQQITSADWKERGDANAGSFRTIR